MSKGSAEPSRNSQRVWFITGTSSGFGLYLVKSALSRGDMVIATARDLSKIDNTVFPPSDRLRKLRLDVNDGYENLREIAKEAVNFWGRIDVLVNNAGYAAVSLTEETRSTLLFREQFQTNVFGLIDVTNAFLPHMRQRRSGLIVQVGSRLSWAPEAPGRALYCSSKAAVHAYSESLAAEIAPFSIKVLIFEPGGFLTVGILANEVYTGDPIPDYDEMRAETIDNYKKARHLIGDPAKAMELLLDVIRGEGKAQGKKLPTYLVCGPGANESVRDKCKIMEDAVKEWDWVTGDLLLDNH